MTRIKDLSAGNIQKLIAEVEALVSHGAETERYEFKREGAVSGDKFKTSQFVKLVQGLANSHLNGPRYIVIGADQKTKSFVPVANQRDFDAATVTAVLKKYLDPLPPTVVLNGVTTSNGIPFVIVIVSSPRLRPVSIKRDLQSDDGKFLLCEGDAWIKEGTANRKVSTADHEKFRVPGPSPLIARVAIFAVVAFIVVLGVGLILWLPRNQPEDLVVSAPHLVPPILPPVPNPKVSHSVIHRPPSSGTQRTPSGSPRLGTGPDPYRDLTDGQVGQWAIDEANKINEMAQHCIDDLSSAAQQEKDPNTIRFFFSTDFNRCCAQGVRDLRSEVLRRLGPPGKDVNEERSWEFLFPDSPIGPPARINAGAVEDYSAYLKRLGLKLKRRSVPRNEPQALNFTEASTSARSVQFPYRIIATVETKETILSGYIIVAFTDQYVGVGSDLSGSRIVGDVGNLDNSPLRDYLAKHRFTYGFEIGTTPFAQTRPIHIVVEGSKPLHISEVILFEE